MRCDRLLLVILLCLAGCPKSGAATSGSIEPCTRSVAGDVATARARLDKGRVQDALLYVNALVACEEALTSPWFLELALDVYEEAGRLNEAWSVGAVALGRVPVDDPAHARLQEHVTAFEATYALIVSPRDGRDGPQIDHRGPVLDDATKAQLRAVRSGRGVMLDEGQRGYWVFPGSYVIEGREVSLVGGGRFEDPRP